MREELHIGGVEIEITESVETVDYDSVSCGVIRPRANIFRESLAQRFVRWFGERRRQCQRRNAIGGVFADNFRRRDADLDLHSWKRGARKLGR